MFNIQLVDFTKLRNLLAGTLVAGLLSCILFTASSAQAQTIIDSNGFESVGLPPLGTGYDIIFDGDGKLEGQHASLPGDSTTTPWLASMGTESTAVVQSAVVHPSDPGGQAVKVTRAVGDNPSFWGAPVSAWPDNARYVCIVWDMLVEGPAGTPGTDFGPFFGVDAYDDVGVGASEIGLIGSMGVVATSGDVVYTDNIQGGGLKPTGTKVNFDEWNRFHIDLDFQLNVYTLYLNDPFLANPLITVPFVGGAGLNDFSDAPIATFQFVNDLAGTAYFDNYLVFQTNVKIPEPSTALLCFAGALVLVPRRRRPLA